VLSIWILLVFTLASIVATLSYIVKNIKKKSLEYNDVIQQNFVGDQVVKEIRGGLFRPIDSPAPLWMNVVESDGSHWTYMAVQIRKAEAVAKPIDEITKELNLEACEYIATGEATQGEFEAGALFAYTIYLRVKTTPSTAYQRARDIITMFQKRGYTVQPMPFYLTYYGVRDTFGRYTSRPTMVLVEQVKMPLIPAQPEIQVPAGPTKLPETLEETTTEKMVPTETEIAAGTVDMSLFDKFISPLHIGYHYYTGEPVYIDIGHERDAGFLVVGPTGSGKSYFAGFLAESAALAGKRVIIIDPEGTHIGYGMENREDMMTPDEVKAITYLTEELGYSYTTTRLPVKVFLIGREDENVPYDEIFRINVSEISPQALAQIIKIEDSLSAAQEAWLRMIVEMLRNEKGKYDLNDILKATRMFIRNWGRWGKKYRKYPDEFLLIEEKSKGPGIYKNVASAMYRRIRELNEKLPGIFVSEGGTDLRKEAEEGKITVITFGVDVRNDDNLLSGVVDYIMNMILECFGPRAPEGTKMLREGLHTLVVCEESRRYIRPGLPARESFRTLVNEGRKYGIHVCVLATNVGYIDKDIIGQLNLAKIIFRPDASTHDEYVKLIPSSERANVKKAYELMVRENWPGAAVVMGGGVNTRKWVLCRLLPRRTLHRPKMDRNEWLEFRRGEKEEGKEEEEAPEEDIIEKARKVLEELRRKKS